MDSGLATYGRKRVLVRVEQIILTSVFRFDFDPGMQASWQLLSFDRRFIQLGLPQGF